MSEDAGQGDKTEEATPERRDEFRKKGQIASSRELTAVVILISIAIFLSFHLRHVVEDLLKLMSFCFERIRNFHLTDANLFDFSANIWMRFLIMVLPLAFVVSVVATLVTLLQTRFNFSFEKIKPDYERMAVLKGLGRMVGGHALVELAKGIGKLSAICIVLYLIFYDKWRQAPGLLNLEVKASFAYLASLTTQLMWGVIGVLLFISVLDYFYQFLSLERQMKMSKEDVKQEYKNRELDPMVRQRMRRMARDFANSKMFTATKSATVIVTNPTHYAVALQYEVGMRAPKVVAKGIDHIALQLREIAKENDVMIIEDPPLARSLYAVVKVGMDIPESLYIVVSEVIKYVFKVKGIKVARGGEA